MNGLIYVIVNKINQKRYVGQTRFTLKYRYPTRWWLRCHNIYLKRSIAKYGIDNFEFEILESNIITIEELNRLEIYHAKRLNTYIPNGYNIRLCGDSRSGLAPETREKLSVLHRKTHTLKRITGEVVKIDNLKKFCRDESLNYQAILNLLCGISNYSQDFVRPETDPNTTIRGKVYEFINPNGDIVRGSVLGVSKKYEIKRHTLYHLISGQCKISKGWTINQHS